MEVGFIGLGVMGQPMAQMFNAMAGNGLGEDDSVAMPKLLERMRGGGRGE